MSYQGQAGRYLGGCILCSASYVERFGTSYRVLDIQHTANCTATDGQHAGTEIAA